MAADLSHINTASTVVGYKGNDQLHAALKDADIVVIPVIQPFIERISFLI